MSVAGRWLSAHESDSVALNITGGTRPMAMDAQSVFGGSGLPTFCVNAETDNVLFLGRRDMTHRLGARVKLRDYLEAHGYRLSANPARPDILDGLCALADRLVDRVESAGAALGQLNRLAQEAKDSLRSPLLNERQRDSITLRDVIDLFAEAKLLKSVDGRLIFADEAARAFVNGGWLEFHVHRALSDLAPGETITDHALNFGVVAPDGKTKNELDATSLHGNRLHIVETKASNLATAGASGDDKATEAIYKLEALLKLGGLRTRAMLVDYRGPASSMRCAAISTLPASISPRPTSTPLPMPPGSRWPISARRRTTRVPPTACSAMCAACAPTSDARCMCRSPAGARPWASSSAMPCPCSAARRIASRMCWSRNPSSR